MPKCDASNYLLKVNVPDGLQGVVDHKDHKGEESKALLEILINAGSKMEAVLIESVLPNRKFRNREAVWSPPSWQPRLPGESGTPMGAFLFADMLCNTASVSDRLRVPREQVVNCIDKGLLRGVKSRTGWFRLVVKDKLHEAITKEMILGTKADQKIKGRGLTGMALEAMKQGLLPTDFCKDDLIQALEKMGWKKHRDYSENSIPGVLLALTGDGRVTLKKSGPLSKRVWTHGQAAAEVTPSASTLSSRIDDMVERLSDEVAERVEKRAKEKMGL